MTSATELSTGEKLSTGPFSASKKSGMKRESSPHTPYKRKAMKLAIIQTAALAAMFLIAAAVSYHSGYVGGRVDEATETEVAK